MHKNKKINNVTTLVIKQFREMASKLLLFYWPVVDDVINHLAICNRTLIMSVNRNIYATACSLRLRHDLMTEACENAIGNGIKHR